MCFYRRFQHLRKHRLTYACHFGHACHIWSRLCIASTKLLVHAVWPDWYETDATDTLQDILREHDRYLRTYINCHVTHDEAIETLTDASSLLDAAAVCDSEPEVLDTTEATISSSSSSVSDAEDESSGELRSSK